MSWGVASHHRDGSDISTMPNVTNGYKNGTQLGDYIFLAYCVRK